MQRHFCSCIPSNNCPSAGIASLANDYCISGKKGKDISHNAYLSLWYSDHILLTMFLHGTAPPDFNTINCLHITRFCGLEKCFELKSECCFVCSQFVQICQFTDKSNITTCRVMIRSDMYCMTNKPLSIN